MLDFKSQRWRELEHAYGSAEDLPQQLTELLTKQYYGNDPHDVLGGCLCHQGTIYSATYAAVPHCVAAFDAQSLEGRIYLLIFIGSVVTAFDPPPIPVDLKADFRSAIEQAKSLAIREARRRGVPRRDYGYILAFLAKIHGLRAIGTILDWLLTSDEINALCRHCRSELHVYPAELPLRVYSAGTRRPEIDVTAATPISELVDIDTFRPSGLQETTSVTPARRPVATWDGTTREDNALSWLLAFSSDAHQPEVAEILLALFGTVDCPSCKRDISLWDSALAGNK